MTAKVGRPKLDPQHKSVPTTVLLTAADRSTLEQLAVRLRMSQSETIRHALRALAERA